MATTPERRDRWHRATGHSTHHHGLLARRDLGHLGITENDIRSWVRTGRLERVTVGVWRVAGSPVTWEQRLQAGLLRLGPGALVSHEAAAAIHGFERTPPGRVEFLIPRRTTRPRIDGTVHTTDLLRPTDRVTVDGWAVTSATRTVLDVAMLRPPPERLEAAIDSAIRLRLTAPVVLLERLGTLRGPGRWGCRSIEALLVDSGGESVLERKFLALIRRAGLPRPQVQFRVHEAGRHVARLDAAWPQVMVAIEVSGQLGHATPSERTSDAQRRDELIDLGWTVYEYTWHHVTREPDYVVRTLRSRLARAGLRW